MWLTRLELICAQSTALYNLISARTPHRLVCSLVYLTAKESVESILYTYTVYMLNGKAKAAQGEANAATWLKLF